eukprot:UN09582
MHHVPQCSLKSTPMLGRFARENSRDFQKSSGQADVLFSSWIQMLLSFVDGLSKLAEVTTIDSHQSSGCIIRP